MDVTVDARGLSKAMDVLRRFTSSVPRPDCYSHYVKIEVDDDTVVMTASYLDRYCRLRLPGKVREPGCVLIEPARMRLCGKSATISDMERVCYIRDDSTRHVVACSTDVDRFAHWPTPPDDASMIRITRARTALRSALVSVDNVSGLYNLNHVCCEYSHGSCYVVGTDGSRMSVCSVPGEATSDGSVVLHEDIARIVASMVTDKQYVTMSSIDDETDWNTIWLESDNLDIVTYAPIRFSPWRDVFLAQLPPMCASIATKEFALIMAQIPVTLIRHRRCSQWVAVYMRVDRGRLTLACDVEWRVDVLGWVNDTFKRTVVLDAGGLQQFARSLPDRGTVSVHMPESKDKPVVFVCHLGDVVVRHYMTPIRVEQ